MRKFHGVRESINDRMPSRVTSIDGLPENIGYTGLPKRKIFLRYQNAAMTKTREPPFKSRAPASRPERANRFYATAKNASASAPKKNPKCFIPREMPSITAAKTSSGKSFLFPAGPAAYSKKGKSPARPYANAKVST